MQTSERAGGSLRGRQPSPFLWAGLLSAPLLLILLALLVGDDCFLNAAVRLAFRPLCHQDPQRSFIIGGQTLAVCARCTGFYGGLAGFSLLGAAAWQAGMRWRLPGVAYLLILPLAVDGLGSLLALWDSPSPLRALTGAAAALPLALAITGMRHDAE